MINPQTKPAKQAKREKRKKRGRTQKKSLAGLPQADPIVLPQSLMRAPWEMPSYPLHRLAQKMINSLALRSTWKEGVEYDLKTRLFISHQIDQ